MPKNVRNLTNFRLNLRMIIYLQIFIFQIWEVVFEPDPKDQTKTTSRVATCGGNSICIVDVNTGTVLMKYKHKELK